LSAPLNFESMSNARTRPAFTMETARCPLCGGDRRSLIAAAPDREAPPPQPFFTVVRCRRCDICYTNPRPRAADIERFYYDDYTPHQPPHNPAKKADPRSKSLLRFFGKKRPNWERGEIDRIGQCRLLDFGCGSGAFLKRMNDRGWQAVGLDFSEKAVKYICDELKIPAFVGTLPNPVFPPQSFDLVTLWHSLEHVHQPLETLREVYNLLAPGGKILVALPNIDSAPFRWFGSAWYGLDLPRHLTHFTPATLRMMMDLAGFEFEAMQMTRHSYWLRQSVQLAIRRDTISPLLRLLKFRLTSSLVSKLYLLAGKSDSFVVIARKVD
jgi:SAM-dependent methyltransferase